MVFFNCCKERKIRFVCERQVIKMVFFNCYEERDWDGRLRICEGVYEMSEIRVREKWENFKYVKEGYVSQREEAKEGGGERKRERVSVWEQMFISRLIWCLVDIKFYFILFFKFSKNSILWLSSSKLHKTRFCKYWVSRGIF